MSPWVMVLSPELLLRALLCREHNVRERLGKLVIYIHTGTRPTQIFASTSKYGYLLGYFGPNILVQHLTNKNWTRPHPHFFGKCRLEKTLRGKGHAYHIDICIGADYVGWNKCLPVCSERKTESSHQDSFCHMSCFFSTAIR